jgi:hypothetical protein
VPATPGTVVSLGGELGGVGRTFATVVRVMPRTGDPGGLLGVVAWVVADPVVDVGALAPDP